MSAADAEAIGDIIAMVPAERSRLMDMVQMVQRRRGVIDDQAIGMIAQRVGIHKVDVEDMVSFYAFLSRTPLAQFQIRLSRTPVSLLKGADAVARAFERALGIAMGETSSDGVFTLQWTSDIGMADQEPAALINSTVLTGLDPEDVPAIVGALRQFGAATTPATDPFSLAPDPVLANLPKARIRSSLIQAGPLLSALAPCAEGLRRALDGTPEHVIEVIAASKLRGRGGAGFPTALKWRAARKTVAKDHYVVCNADEGEPGTFKDRVLLAEFPDLVFDGMTIAGYAVGARHGLLYLRGEYAYMWDALQAVLARRRQAGLLGQAILGVSGFDFDIRIQLGAGAYICGEESALLESLEGKRGAPRDRPPFPTERGYLQQPTAINNVETLVCVARILEKGAPWFLESGTEQSSGTKLICVSGDCPVPGVYEVPFGMTLNALLDLIGAADVQAVQVSGPSGHCIAPKDFGRRLAYEDLSTGGSTMIFGNGRDLLGVALSFTEFFVTESCGWCVPCRVGTTELKRGMEKIVAGNATLDEVHGLERLAGTVMRMSRCGLGQTAPNPILSTMRNFPELYEARLRAGGFVAAFGQADQTRNAQSIARES